MLPSLSCVVERVGKRRLVKLRRRTRELVVEEAERVRGAERFAPEFKRRAHEAAELKRKGGRHGAALGAELLERGISR